MRTHMHMHKKNIRIDSYITCAYVLWMSARHPRLAPRQVQPGGAAHGGYGQRTTLISLSLSISALLLLLLCIIISMNMGQKNAWVRNAHAFDRPCRLQNAMTAEEGRSAAEGLRIEVPLAALSSQHRPCSQRECADKGLAQFACQGRPWSALFACQFALFCLSVCGAVG